MVDGKAMLNHMRELAKQRTGASEGFSKQSPGCKTDQEQNLAQNSERRNSRSEIISENNATQGSEGSNKLRKVKKSTVNC